MVCAYGACNAARCSLHKCMHCDWMGKGVREMAKRVGLGVSGLLAGSSPEIVDLDRCDWTRPISDSDASRWPQRVDPSLSA